MHYIWTHFLKSYRMFALLGMIGKGIEVVFEVLVPTIIMLLLDRGLALHDLQVSAFYVALLVVCACISFCSTLGCQYIAAYISQSLTKDIEEALFAHIMRLDFARFEQLGSESIMRRGTQDIDHISLACGLFIRQAIRGPMLMVTSIICAVLLNPSYGLVFCVCVPVVCCMFWYVLRRLIRMFSTLQAMLDRMSARVFQNLYAYNLIHISHTSRLEETQFEHENKDYTDLVRATQILSFCLSPIVFFIMNIGIFLVLALVYQGVHGLLPFLAVSKGTVAALISYMTQTFLAIIAISNLCVVLGRGYAAAFRIEELLREKTSDISRATTVAAAPSCEQTKAPSCARANAFVIQDLAFSYYSESASFRYALHGVSLSLPLRGFIGCVGPCGSGKTTFLKLLSGLYMPTRGSISLNECALPHTTFNNSYPSSSFVYLAPQLPSLMLGSIADFLSSAAQAPTRERMRAALARASMLERVMSFSDGLDHQILAGGSNFSGGERQRLSLARAFMSDAPIILIDNCLEGLDAGRARTVREEIKALGKEKLVIYVTQLPELIKDADMILVFSAGTLEASGTDEELMQKSASYRQLHQEFDLYPHAYANPAPSDGPAQTEDAASSGAAALAKELSLYE